LLFTRRPTPPGAFIPFSLLSLFIGFIGWFQKCRNGLRDADAPLQHQRPTDIPEYKEVASFGSLPHRNHRHPILL
jgi:hypothetical protein